MIEFLANNIAVITALTSLLMTIGTGIMYLFDKKKRTAIAKQEAAKAEQEEIKVKADKLSNDEKFQVIYDGLMEDAKQAIEALRKERDEIRVERVELKKMISALETQAAEDKKTIDALTIKVNSQAHLIEKLQLQIKQLQK